MKKIFCAALILTLLCTLTLQIPGAQSFSVRVPSESTLIIRTEPRAWITLRSPDGRPVACWRAEHLALTLPPGEYSVEVRGAKTLYHTLIHSKSGKGLTKKS